MSKKAIQPRKHPKQDRSRTKVKQILEGALRLLENGGIETVTAVNIAKESGTAVGSVYQYFPNAKSVIFELYRNWLDAVMERFDAVEKQYYLKVPGNVFFNHLADAFTGEILYSPKAESQLYRVREIFPSIEVIDREHGMAVTERVAGYLRGYGSNWSEKRLKRFGLFLYEITITMLRCYIEEDQEANQDFNGWSRSMLLPLIEECLMAGD